MKKREGPIHAIRKSTEGKIVTYGAVGYTRCGRPVPAALVRELMAHPRRKLVLPLSTVVAYLVANARKATCGNCRT